MASASEQINEYERKQPAQDSNDSTTGDMVHDRIRHLIFNFRDSDGVEKAVKDLQAASAMASSTPASATNGDKVDAEDDTGLYVIVDEVCRDIE